MVGNDGIVMAVCTRLMVMDIFPLFVVKILYELSYAFRMKLNEVKAFLMVKFMDISHLSCKVR